MKEKKPRWATLSQNCKKMNKKAPLGRNKIVRRNVAKEGKKFQVFSTIVSFRKLLLVLTFPSSFTLNLNRKHRHKHRQRHKNEIQQIISSFNQNLSRSVHGLSFCRFWKLKEVQKQLIPNPWKFQSNLLGFILIPLRPSKWATEVFPTALVIVPLVLIAFRWRQSRHTCKFYGRQSFCSRGVEVEQCRCWSEVINRT